MTLVSRWLVGLALLAACSVSHRSSDFACEQQADCATGRTCIDGYCVAMQADASVLNDATGDARPIDASACPQQCTTCDIGTTTCTIDCMLAGGACNGPIRCPEGWNCNVLCSVTGSCSNGLVCPGNRECNVTCSGRGSCNRFMCGSGPCDIECTGTNSCNELSCGAACACDINCASGTSCNSRPLCKADDCRLGRGCTSKSIPAPLCNDCLVF